MEHGLDLRIVLAIVALTVTVFGGILKILSKINSSKEAIVKEIGKITTSVAVAEERHNALDARVARLEERRPAPHRAAHTRLSEM